MGRATGLRRLGSGGRGTWAEVEQECRTLDKSCLRIATVTLDPDPSGCDARAPVQIQVTKEPQRSALTITIPRPNFDPFPPLRSPGAQRRLHFCPSADPSAPPGPSRARGPGPTLGLRCATTAQAPALEQAQMSATGTPGESRGHGPARSSPSSSEPRGSATPNTPTSAPPPSSGHRPPCSPGVDGNVLEYFFCLEMLDSLMSPSALDSLRTGAPPTLVAPGPCSTAGIREQRVLSGVRTGVQKTEGQWRRCSSTGMLAEGALKATGGMERLVLSGTCAPTTQAACFPSSPGCMTQSSLAMTASYPHSLSDNMPANFPSAVYVGQGSPVPCAPAGSRGVGPVAPGSSSPSTHGHHVASPERRDQASSPGAGLCNAQAAGATTPRTGVLTPRCPAPKARPSHRRAVSCALDHTQGDALVSPGGSARSPGCQRVPPACSCAAREGCRSPGNLAPKSSVALQHTPRAAGGCGRGQEETAAEGGGDDGAGRPGVKHGGAAGCIPGALVCSSPAGEHAPGSEASPGTPASCGLFSGAGRSDSTCSSHSSPVGTTVECGNIMQQWKALPRKDGGSTRYGHLVTALPDMERRAKE